MCNLHRLELLPRLCVQDIRQQAVDSYLVLLARHLAAGSSSSSISSGASADQAAVVLGTGLGSSSGAASHRSLSLLPPILVHVMAWVCGEFAQLSSSTAASDIALKLVQLLGVCVPLSLSLRFWMCLWSTVLHPLGVSQTIVCYVLCAALQVVRRASTPSRTPGF